jgi:hypothetical protein
LSRRLRNRKEIGLEYFGAGARGIGYWIDNKGRSHKVPLNIEHDRWIAHITEYKNAKEAFRNGWIRANTKGTFDVYNLDSRKIGHIERFLDKKLDPMKSKQDTIVINDFKTKKVSLALFRDWETSNLPKAIRMFKSRYGTYRSESVGDTDKIRQYILEKYYTTVKHVYKTGETVDVFINPTSAELYKNLDSWREEKKAHALLTLSGDLYVWDMFAGMLHQHMIPKLKRSGISLVLSKGKVYLTPTVSKIRKEFKSRHELSNFVRGSDTLRVAMGGDFKLDPGMVR